MAISSVGAAAAPHIKPQTVTVAIRAVDGDRKVPGPNTAKVKDADGDYKVLTPAAAAAAKSSSAVREALSSLQKGG